MAGSQPLEEWKEIERKAAGLISLFAEENDNGEKMSVSVFNRCWSKVILETLVRQGVSHVCIAPGSRSTPLTLEAVRLQNAGSVTCHTHFDERGLGFCLGYC